jgi:hypothetical protein
MPKLMIPNDGSSERRRLRRLRRLRKLRKIVLTIYRQGGKWYNNTHLKRRYEYVTKRLPPGWTVREV